MSCYEFGYVGFWILTTLFCTALQCKFAMNQRRGDDFEFTLLVGTDGTVCA